MIKLFKFLLNSEEQKLGQALADSNITGAEVVGRGTIVVDGRVIASSTEFQALKLQARKIISSRESARI